MELALRLILLVVAYKQQRRAAHQGFSPFSVSQYNYEVSYIYIAKNLNVIFGGQVLQIFPITVVYVAGNKHNTVALGSIHTDCQCRLRSHVYRGLFFLLQLYNVFF